MLNYLLHKHHSDLVLSQNQIRYHKIRAVWVGKKKYIYLPICRIKFIPWTKNQHKKIWNIVQFLSYSTHSLNADVWDCGITKASRPILDVSSYLPICRIKFIPWTKNQHKKIWNIVQFLSYSTHSLNADVWDCGITKASRPILDVSSLRKSIKFLSTYQRTVIW